MCDFNRRSVIQAHDEFPSQSELAKVDAFIRSQRVQGELVITYPGNGGRDSVVFKGKPVVHRGQVETLRESD